MQYGTSTWYLCPRAVSSINKVNTDCSTPHAAPCAGATAQTVGAGIAVRCRHVCTPFARLVTVVFLASLLYAWYDFFFLSFFSGPFYV